MLMFPRPDNFKVQSSLVSSSNDSIVCYHHNDRRVFLGGLHCSTEERVLQKYCEQFGQVLSVEIKRDVITQRSRGFAFVTFRDKNGVRYLTSIEDQQFIIQADSCISEQKHFIDQKCVQAKRAKAPEECGYAPRMFYKPNIHREPGFVHVRDVTCKLFVGGIAAGTTEDSFYEYFAQFGAILDSRLMTDATTGRHRGFGFITFCDKATLDLCMRKRPHFVDGRHVDCKRAMPEKSMAQVQYNCSTNRLVVHKHDVSEEALNSYFSQFGTVTRIELGLDEKGEASPHEAVVCFDDYDPVDQCMLADGHEIDGTYVTARKALREDELSKAQRNRDRVQRQQQCRTSKLHMEKMQQPPSCQVAASIINFNALSSTLRCNSSFGRAALLPFLIPNLKRLSALPVANMRNAFR